MKNDSGVALSTHYARKISKNDIEDVVEMLEGTHMNNIQIKKAQKDEAIPMFQV